MTMVFLLLILTTNIVNAQFPIERNRSLLDFSYSNLGETKTFYLGIEHTFFNDISLGISVVRMENVIPLQGSWSYKREIYYSEFFANYYFNRLLKLPERIMLYAGADLLLMPNPYPTHFGVQSGVRYCFGKKLCIGTEYQISPYFHRLSVGVQIRI